LASTQDRPVPGPIQEDSAGLVLEDLLEMVRATNPRLRAAGFRVDATRTREAEAGLLPDPTLMVGVSNLALPEFSATMPASMAPVFQVTQRIPIAGKLSLREEIARQTTEIQAASAEETWWAVRTQAATSFYALYRIDGQTEVLKRTLGLLGDLGTVALSNYSAGTGPQADVLRADVAVARTEADLRRLEALRTGAEARLNGLLDQPAATHIPSPQLGSLPAELPPTDSLVAWATENRPAIRGLRLGVERAETNYHLAERAIWPDLSLGVQYGLGRMQGDPRSMGGASVGFSIPIYAGRRQGRMKDEASAMASMAGADLQDAIANVRSEVGRLVAEVERARALIGLYREDILPQARASVEASLSSYRVGAVDFMALIDAQMAANRFEGEYVELLADFGTALAQLEQTVGREIPAGEDAILEIS